MIRRTAIMLMLAAVIIPSAAWADLVFSDTIAVSGVLVKLRAEIRGKVFAKGGEMVEFKVDGKSLGQVLSGGDGIAYKEYRFDGPGIHNITVHALKEENSGEVLVIRPTDAVVLVEVEGSLVKQDFMKRLARQDAAETMRMLAGKYRIAYLAGGLPGKQAIKIWLKDNGFPDAPVIDMGEGLFKELTKNSVRVRAVIGSDDVASRAQKTGAELFVFGKGKHPKGAERVKSWAQIRASLLGQ